MSASYYFTGDCSDPIVQDEIKNNFIKTLSASVYRDACLVYAKDCNVDNVQASIITLKNTEMCSLYIKNELHSISPCLNKTQLIRIWCLKSNLFFIKTNVIIFR